MIEKFQDYLVRHGVVPDIAEMMHDAAYKGVAELRAVGIPGEFDGDEMVAMLRAWQEEVGELTHAVSRARRIIVHGVIDALREKYPDDVEDWFVANVTTFGNETIRSAEEQILK